MQLRDAGVVEDHVVVGGAPDGDQGGVLLLLLAHREHRRGERDLERPEIDLPLGAVDPPRPRRLRTPGSHRGIDGGSNEEGEGAARDEVGAMQCGQTASVEG